MIRLLAILSITILSFTSVAGNEISLSQSLDKPSLAYEDRAVLELEITWPGPQTAFHFPFPLKPQVEGVRIGKSSTSISSGQAGDGEQTVKTFRFTLIPTRSGIARIEPITVSYVTWPDSILGELVGEPLELEIATPIPVEKPTGVAPALVWALIGLVAIGLVGAVVWFVRKDSAPTESAHTPRDTALTALAQLKDVAGSDIKRFQTGLYDLLMRYLKEETGDDLSGLTIEDIEKKLVASDLASRDRVRILEWLKRAEFEKYAPVAQSPGDTVRLANEVREFFEKK